MDQVFKGNEVEGYSHTEIEFESKRTFENFSSVHRVPLNMVEITTWVHNRSVSISLFGSENRGDYEMWVRFYTAVPLRNGTLLSEDLTGPFCLVIGALKHCRTEERTCAQPQLVVRRVKCTKSDDEGSPRA